MTYAQQLQDPRWLAKSAALIERAGHRCQECGATKGRMNAHHTYYEPGRSAWEYPDEAFQVRCEACHEVHHLLEREAKRLLGALYCGGLMRVLDGIKDELRQQTGTADVPGSAVLRESVEDAWRILRTTQDHDEAVRCLRVIQRA